MKDVAVEILKKGLRGHNSHVPPLKAIRGIDAEIARKRASKKAHTIWDILHHIVLWQDVTLQAIQLKTVDWTQAHEHEWPKAEETADDSEWNKLCERFTKGLVLAEELVEKVDITSTLPSWSDAPAGKAFLVLIQHNSYHLGQIVTLREILGIWPPPEE